MHGNCPARPAVFLRPAATTFDVAVHVVASLFLAQLNFIEVFFFDVLLLPDLINQKYW